MDNNSLSHTKWNCKYHIVFAPKYRRKIIYGELKRDIANILSMLCKRKEVNIVEAEICPDHVHMLVEIPPKMSVSEFMSYLKGKSTLMLFDRHPEYHPLFLFPVVRPPFRAQTVFTVFLLKTEQTDPVFVFPFFFFCHF